MENYIDKLSKLENLVYKLLPWFMLGIVCFGIYLLLVLFLDNADKVLWDVTTPIVRLMQ